MDEDTTIVDAAVGSEAVIADGAGLTQCELLCFIQGKSSVMAFDDLLEVCSSFYTTKEVEKARSLVSGFLPDRRLAKHKGSEKERVRKTMTDLIKLCLDPSVKLPAFCVLDISRLPPVGVEHVDVSLMLQEISSLRQEVRAMAELRAEIDSIKSTLQSLVEKRDTVLQDVLAPVARQNLNYNVEYPSLNTNAYPNSQDMFSNAEVPYAIHAASLKDDGIKERPNQPKRRIPPVVGRSTANKCVSSVQTLRTVDVFVSRLNPYTNAAELKDCVDCVKDDLPLSEVVCTKLRSKYAHLYVSYHVAITVNAGLFAKAIDKFMCPDVWPSGVLVRRYFKPKNGERAS